MENISHSLPKRSFSSNPNAAFTSHKSVYDDVFGAPPKYGLPTLAPRLDDYSEIFGGFHASRSSSIPLLQLIPHDSDLHFDVRSSSFDYTEVFGDFGGLDFTASFEDLIGQSRGGGGYDSSDDPWSPTHSESFSDELEPLAGSDKSRRLSDGDLQQPLKSIKHFNASYNKSIQRSMETVLAPTSNSVPGFTFSHYESSVSWDGDDDHSSMGVVDDINHSKEFGGRVRKENQYKSSNPLPSGVDTHGNECNPLEKHVNSTSPPDKPFVTVSDISLRTEPSRLPPPVRPPPVLVVRKGECDRSNAKLEASKSYAFNSVTDDSALLSFDVEIDATISAEGRENGNKNVEVMNRSTKEPIERKYTWSYSSTRVEEKTDRTVRVSSGVEDDELLQSHGKETAVSVPVIEERIEIVKNTKGTSGSPRVHCCNPSAEKSSEAVAWREETEYFELIENNISRQAYDISEDCDTSTQHVKQDAYIHQEKTEYDTCSQMEDCNEFKVTKEPHRWDEETCQPQMNGEHYDCGDKQQMDIPDTRLSDQKGSPEKLMLNKLACDFLQLGEHEKLQRDHNETLEVKPDAKGNVNEVEAKLKLTGSPKRINIEKRFVEPQVMKQKSGKHNQKNFREELQRRLEDVEGAKTTREIVKVGTGSEGTKKRHTGVSGNQIENKLEETYELKENDMVLKEAKKNRESGKKSYVAAEYDKGGDEWLTREEDMEAVKQGMNELTFSEVLKQIGDDKEHSSVHERDVIKQRNGDASKTDDNFLRSRMSSTEAGNKKETFETIGNMNLSRDSVLQGQLSGHVEELEPIKRNGNESEVERDLDCHVQTEWDRLKVIEGEYKAYKVITAKVPGKNDNIQMWGVTKEAVSSEGNGELKTESKSRVYESGTRMDDRLAKARFNESSKHKEGLHHKNIHHVTKNTFESPCLSKQVSDSDISFPGMGISYVMPDKMSSALEYVHEPVKIVFSDSVDVQKMNSAQLASKRVDIRDNINPSLVIRESVVSARKVEDDSSLLRINDDTLFPIKSATSQRIERKDVHMKDKLAAKDQKIGERIRKETTLENEHMRKLEEEREREREREKDRMAVDKEALEARERSYFEARERAERSAVERATAGVRQRAMAEARASMEARLRAERAAVERATSEARQRATEKLMSLKSAFDPHDQVERSVPDRFSATSRFADTRQSYVSSDLYFQSTGISSDRTFTLDGAEGESPQRCKARLERCRRTSERAANALAEKNRRDLLAQREREERNRVGEALDAEVKRWSSGKEGNLRALLSTLQYILGPESGWHPVPLTEVITSAAVKKAYRKATLCVHPDKLQQRGATIQQKYISEKVFDLLKEAWNKFNSEER
ncbi:hypothetical protein ACS0TY_030628 [Phlomoides rotata]